MEIMPTRQIIAGRIGEPLNENKELFSINYEEWTKQCLKQIIELRDRLASGMYLSNPMAEQILTKDQVENYLSCHRIWLKQNEDISKRIYKSYEKLARIVRGRNIEKRTFNLYEAEQIIKLCDYLIFQYNKALDNMLSSEIITSVERLTARGVITQKEAEIYANKAYKERIDGDKTYIKDVLITKGKDPEAIDSMLLLVKTEGVAKKLKELVEENNYVSVVQIIDEVKTLNK